MHSKEEISTAKSRSIISTVSLLAQSSYSAALGFFAFFILTKASGVYLLGVYSTVDATLTFFGYLTNLGIAAALMQKKDVDEVDLSTAFYLQTGLTALAAGIAFFFTKQLLSHYSDLPQYSNYLFWALLISLVVISLKTIPSILLEKEIQIQKVVVAQVIENTFFYAAIIGFVTAGFGVISLIIAVLLRDIVGLVAIYVMKPWRPSLSFSWEKAKAMTTYGLQFQGNSFLALIKDNLLILYLGSALGFRNLGYVTFGKKYAEFAIRLIMDTINRVAFPLFAKFQANKTLLSKSFQRVAYYQTFILFPLIVGGVFVFHVVLQMIPGYFDKWQYALPSFYFFSISSFFVALSNPYINLFNATGKVRWSLMYTAFLTTVSWITILLFIRLYGYNGVARAFALFSIFGISLQYFANRIIPHSLWRIVQNSVISTLVMVVGLLALRMGLAGAGTLSPIVLLGINGLLGGLLYITAHYVQDRESIRRLYSLVIPAGKKRI